MAGDYSIDIDLSELIGAINGPISAAVFPTVHQAVRAVASETASRWKDAVSKAKLWNGEKQAYIQSINWRMDGDYAAVVEAGYKNAGAIETGRPAYDMKQMLLTSKKVRYVTKGKNAGKRYLIIPFRHNVPSDSSVPGDQAGAGAHARQMPSDIYKLAKQLAPSRVTGSKLQHNGGKGARVRLVPRPTYDWGERLPAGLAPKLKPSHAADPYANMVRFNTSAGNGKSSSYMTFRVMMEGSSKWIIGPRPGLHLAQKVSEEISAEAPAVFQHAMAFALK